MRMEETKDYLLNLQPKMFDQLESLSRLTAEPISVIIRRAINEYLRNFKLDNDAHQ